MEDEGQIAVGTAERLAAVAAQHECRRAAAVDEEYPLLATGLQAAEPIGQGPREDRPISRGELSSHVDELDRRRASDAALGQGVGVEAGHPQLREAPAQLSLDALGSGPEIPDARARAARATIGSQP